MIKSLKRSFVCKLLLQHFAPLRLSQLCKALLFIFITAYSFNALSFEESIKLDIDKDMLNQRQELFVELQ